MNLNEAKEILNGNGYYLEEVNSDLLDKVYDIAHQLGYRTEYDTDEQAVMIYDKNEIDITKSTNYHKLRDMLNKIPEIKNILNAYLEDDDHYAVEAFIRREYRNR